MGSIGLAYFIIVLLAWVCKFQDKKTFQELALLIGNRMLLVVSTLYSLVIFFQLYTIWAAFTTAPVPNYYINVAYLTGGVVAFLLFLVLFFLIPYFTKNIWYSSGMAIVILHQAISLFNPQISIENILYEFFEGSDVSYSLEFIVSNYFVFLIENIIFLLTWFFFFHRMKKKIRPKENIILENHLIQN